jgi:aldose 1-epimerase
MPQPPSGEQFAITAGDATAVVVEVGGGLRTYSSGGRDILFGYAEDEMSSAGRGQALIPWPNRIGDGRYTFDGSEHELALNEVGKRTAIHGLVRWSPWTAVEHEPHRVVMAHTLHPQPGYPFTLELSIAYELSEGGLSVRTTATNAGAKACPYGLGFHPYLAAAGGGTIDRLDLRVPATRMLRSDERGLPAGWVDVDGTDCDFRSARPVGELVLDNCFTGLARDDDGRARVTIGGTTLWMDEAYGYAMVFSGDPIPDVNRRALAVEPMSCPPDAFRTGEAVVRLEPGESHAAGWGITP